MRTTLVIAAAVLTATIVPSQSLVVPNALSTTEGNSSTAYPWNRATQVRAQYFYDSANFTSQSITFPIAITRLRWRVDGAATCVGRVYNNVTVQCCTAPVDHLAVTSTFANNRGLDLVTVASGQATVIAVPAASAPGSFYVDVPLTTPFAYDPTVGDLMVEIDHDGTYTGGTSASTDLISGTVNLSSRVWHSTSQTATTSQSVQPNIAVAMEITYSVGSGIATASRYGTGCPAGAPLTLAASPRPILGNTVVLTTTAIPATTQLGVTILSFTQFNPGLSMTPIGMAGCFQYTGLDATLLFLPAGGTGSSSIGIPTNASYSGMHVFSQSATFSSGLNTFGVIASNGLDLGLGTQ
jgi:hypothetical protein